jgi:hypothetical protein
MLNLSERFCARRHISFRVSQARNYSNSPIYTAENLSVLNIRFSVLFHFELGKNLLDQLAIDTKAS